MLNREIENTKVQAIIAINKEKNSSVCKQIVALAQILINETREYNDTAAGNDVLLNQGRIDALKQIITSIVVGIPTH